MYYRKYVIVNPIMRMINILYKLYKNISFGNFLWDGYDPFLIIDALLISQLKCALHLHLIGKESANWASLNMVFFWCQGCSCFYYDANFAPKLIPKKFPTVENLCK